MGNDKLEEIVKAIGKIGFTVIEVKQETKDGTPGIVESNGRGATGTVLIRMVPSEN